MPCAFISGITGRFFRQFAVTIAVLTVLSALNSLTLSPVLAALLLNPDLRTRSSVPAGAERKVVGRRDPLTWLLETLFGWFFRIFNRVFSAGTTAYARVVGRLLRVSILVLLAYAGLLVLTVRAVRAVALRLRPAAGPGSGCRRRAIARFGGPGAAQETVARAEQIALDRRRGAYNHHLGRVARPTGLRLQPRHDVHCPRPVREAADSRPERRCDHGSTARGVAAADQGRDSASVRRTPDPGLSVAGGFMLMVEDRAGLGAHNLQKQTDVLIGKLRASAA